MGSITVNVTNHNHDTRYALKDGTVTAQYLRLGIGKAADDVAALVTLTSPTHVSNNEQGASFDARWAPGGALTGSAYVYGLYSRGLWNSAQDGSTNANVIGIYGTARSAQTATGAVAVLAAIQGIAIHHGSGTAGQLTGVRGYATNQQLDDAGATVGATTGNVTAMYSFKADAQNNKATGVVTNRYGLYVTDLVGGGTLTNQYGIYIPALTAGGTANWALYNAGAAPSYFGGAVRVGDAAPDGHADLHVSKTARARTLSMASPTRTGVVCFVFDDATVDAYTILAPIFEAQGERCTIAVPGSLIGTAGYCTASQVQALHAAGHEIADHTYTHSYGALDNLTTYTEAQLHAEFALSQATLSALGIDAKNLVYPGGYYNDLVSRVASQYYRSARGTSEGLNSLPLETYGLKVRNIQGTVGDLPTYYGYVDQCVASGTLLIFYGHQVYNGDLLNPLIDYIQASGAELVTLDGALDLIENELTIGSNVMLSAQHGLWLHSNYSGAFGRGRLKITHTGAVAGVAYGAHISMTGAGTTNVAMYLNASGATNNYALVTGTGGDIGFGTTAPTHKVEISDTSSVVSRAGLRISQSGAMAGTGYGAYITKTGAGTTNVAMYLAASGATNNWGLVVPVGDVGIGANPTGTTKTYIRTVSTVNNYIGLRILHDGVSDTTGYAMYCEKQGAGVNNIAAYIAASGGTHNYAIITGGGNSGFGIASPTHLVHVNGTFKAVGDATLAGALDHDGTTVGFFGTAPIAQAQLATGVGHSVDDVITALQNLGLVKQAA